MPPRCRLSRLRVPMELAEGRAGCEVRPASGVLVRRPPPGWSRRGRNEAFGCCTTRLLNTHKLGKYEIFYEYHPWFGREVGVQGVVEKGIGVARCTLQGEAQARALEVPLWMFDRLTCLSVRIRKRPEVDLAALDVLQSLLAEVSRPREDAPAVSSITPDSVTDLPSVNQDQGGDHGSISQGTKATGSVRSRQAGRTREHAAMAESAASDAAEGRQAAGKVVHRTLSDSGDEGHRAERRSSTRGGR